LKYRGFFTDFLKASESNSDRLNQMLEARICLQIRRDFLESILDKKSQGLLSLEVAYWRLNKADRPLEGGPKLF